MTASTSAWPVPSTSTSTSASVAGSPRSPKMGFTKESLMGDTLPGRPHTVGRDRLPGRVQIPPRLDRRDAPPVRHGSSTRHGQGVAVHGGGPAAERASRRRSARAPAGARPARPGPARRTSGAPRGERATSSSSPVTPVSTSRLSQPIVTAPSMSVSSRSPITSGRLAADPGDGLLEQRRHRLAGDLRLALGELRDEPHQRAVARADPVRGGDGHVGVARHPRQPGRTRIAPWTTCFQGMSGP